MTTTLRVGWHREHFLSPLLQFAEKDADAPFELIECPGGTGEMQVKLKNGEIDLCIGVSFSFVQVLISPRLTELKSIDRCAYCWIGKWTDGVQVGWSVHCQSVEMVLVFVQTTKVHHSDIGYTGRSSLEKRVITTLSTISRAQLSVYLGWEGGFTSIMTMY